MTQILPAILPQPEPVIPPLFVPVDCIKLQTKLERLQVGHVHVAKNMVEKFVSYIN